MTHSDQQPYVTLDTNWTGRPKSIAAVLIQSDGVNALIDPGPASTLETLRAELGRNGVRVQDLNTILLTHIHLDHAGAVGSLVKENPKLSVFVHEFGAPRIADPSKLLASARRLYAEQMDILYGDVLPVPEENLRPLAGGETVSIGKRDFEILYTPGHASHHLTFWDAQDRTAFVGDVGGITVEGDSFIMPATPPPDIDLELWNKSLDAISALRPARLFLTHFGYQHDPTAHIAAYRKKLAEWSGLVKSLLENGESEEAAAKEFVEAVAAETKRDVSIASEADHYIFNGGLYLSWLGLLRFTKKQKEKSQAAT
ncbi:MAG TPA: MBL fold metallo-hydrolase [Candidatus Dormibacteraeota bacterium]|jgi:glyoxylase-like metal-dependent hydrolase (beta-lactamase superfamily II)|nr:MBL fold metallo-hydrolase [Candidatus Dormibacteraeota bacterium]